MLKISGTYYNGELKLDKPFKSKKPVKVLVSFEEEKSSLDLSDFTFLQTQELLKDFKGTSFGDEVVSERSIE